MKIVSGNFSNQTNQNQPAETGGKKNSASINVKYSFDGKNDIRKEQAKIRAQKNEMDIRKMEDKLIKEYQRQITNIQDTETDDVKKKNKIAELMYKIKEIYRQRTEREQEAAKREAEEMQAEFEKERQAREEKQKKAAPPKHDTEEDLYLADVEDMIKISVSYDSIRALKQAKANISAEAEQLRQEIDSSLGIMQLDSGDSITVKNGYDKPNDFRNTHMIKLQKGIAGIEATINSKVGNINRNARNWAKDKNNIMKAQEADIKDSIEKDLIKKGKTKTDETVTKNIERAEKSAGSPTETTASNRR